MQGQTASMHLADHSAGCPTSPTQPLWLPDNPHICLLAYGASSAGVVVQQAQAPASNATSLSEHNVHHHNVAVLPTVLRMTSLSEPDEVVSTVAWSSQGVESKLAAVAGSTLAVFSLEHYISAIVQQSPLVLPHPGQTPACQAQHTCPLVALSWTQEGDGLLSADTEGRIIMWRVTTTSDQSQQLTQAWIGGSSTVIQPQSILAAGANILSPSASACRGTKYVTIWWPEEIQHSSAEPAVPIPAAKDTDAPAMVAVAEQLRHPVGVVVAQWSPGSLQPGSSFTSSEQDGSPLAAMTAQPALMTVGYDGMIRIWVEVTLSPSLGAQAPGSPSRLAGPSTPSSPGTPANLVRGHQLLGSSQFCLTLVVQPPNSTLIGFQPDSLRACWGVPCQGPLGPANRMAAGSVLWILAMVDGAQQAKAADSKAAPEGPSDQLLLWAVEGLAGVVINGIPNNVPGTRALNTPKAMLWGQHDTQLTWPGGSSVPIAERQLACNVSLHDDSPVLHVVESCSQANHAGITLRKYTLHSVDDDTSHALSPRAASATSAVPPRQLPLHDYTTQAISGHQSPIVCLASHPTQPLVFTADQGGLNMLWCTGPLTPLGGLAAVLGGSPADGKTSLVSSACWLKGQAQCSSTVVAGILAVGVGPRVSVIGVTARHATESSGPNAAELEQLACIDLPSAFPSLQGLSVLPDPCDLKPPSAGHPHPTTLPGYILVGSLSKKTQSELQSRLQSTTFDAVAFWQVMLPPGQGQTQRASPQGRLKLVLCHEFEDSSGEVTCAVSVSGVGFQLMLGTTQGGIQLLKAESIDQATNLVTVRELQGAAQSAGLVCDLAMTSGGSHVAAALHSVSGKDSCVQIWQAESAPPESQYVLDASVILSDTPTAVAWLPSCAITPTFAIACSNSTQIFNQTHGHGWAAIANLGNLGQPFTALQLDHKGLPILTAGNQLGSVSCLVQAHAGSSSSGANSSHLLQMPLGQLSLEVSGPLPDYAPAALALMIARGRIQAARDVIHHLLAWLKLHDSSLQPQNLDKSLDISPFQQQLLPDATLDALLDRPCLRDLSSVVAALPLSNAPAQIEHAGSRQPTAQQHKHQTTLDQGSTAGDAKARSGVAGTTEPASAQKDHSKSKPALADPFAFDPGAFGGGGTADEEEEEQAALAAHPAAAADPFAFDAGAFGMGQEQEVEEAAQAQPAQRANDPFAFDAGAFGFGEEGSAEQPQASAQSPAAFDPHAFDAGAFGMTDVQPKEEHMEEEEQNSSKPAAAPADAFAFDPGAFGFSGEEQPQQPHQATAPAAASASATTSAAATDPFAFTPDAFGFSSMTHEEEEQTQPEVAPAENAQASAADPYAFDAGAFGLEPSREEDRAALRQAQTGADPFTFDPGAFGMGPSAAAPQQGISPDTTPARPQATPNSPVKQLQAQASQRRNAALPNTQQQSPSIKVYKPKKSSSPSKQPATVSSSALDCLQRLLGTALSQAADAHPSGEPTSPTSPEGLAHCLTSALPPGLTPHSTHALLRIAHMLCDNPPPTPSPSSQQGGAVAPAQGNGISSIPVDWPALDEAAQKAVRALQLAVCSMASASDVESNSSNAGGAAPQSREVLDGLMAAPRQSSQTPPSKPSKSAIDLVVKDGSWGAEMGVITGLGPSALMWALLSESQDALLTHTISQLPAVDSHGALAPPEFGFATSGDPPSGTGGPALTWGALRLVGAGFWLTEQQVVVARAETLAKAQFAHRRDPHDCALLYLALKKKQLLMSLFRGGNHKKQADFLMRDFSQDKSKDAACKNAYTLLGQHRHELAAAFFVLGGAYKDAVGVCAHEMGDPQLALFLARLLEGGQSSLQQHLLSHELLLGAQEKQDPWAECLLTWLQGRPSAALQRLLPQAPPEQASESSDRSITPGQLNTSPPTTSGRGQTSQSPSSHLSPSSSNRTSPPYPQSSTDSTHTASPMQLQKQWTLSLALDLLAYCLVPGSVTWPGQLPHLRQLCQLATEAAHGLEVTGHPVMALEALQIAQMCCKRLVSSLQSEDSSQEQKAALQQQQHILSSWQDRLVTACLMRCLIDATQPEPLSDPLLPPTIPLNPQDAQHLISQRWTLHRNKALAVTPLPNPNQWKKLAQQQLKVLADCGIVVDADKALGRLQTMCDSLLPDPPSRVDEPAGLEAGGTGLFRSISGMSAASTPRRNSTLSSGVMSSASGAVFDESHRLLHVDSDRLHAVCASNAGVYGYAGADGRPFAAASVKHGIVVGEVSLVTLPAARQSEDGQQHHAGSEAASKGTTFSAMLGDMLEAVRWPQDPTPTPSSPFSRGGTSKGGKPESPSATRVRVPVGQIGTSTLAAHPTRQLFLTGCASGEIYLCQFGETKAKAGYTPMPAHLEAPAPSPHSLFTTPPKSWNASPGVNFTHWGQPQAVCWSDDGERFAGLGDGGVVATWRLDAPRMAASDTAYLGRSDWCHQGLSKRGMDVTYLGSGNSVLAVAGQCSQGGNIVIWDTQRPLTSGPVARLSYHLAAVTALKVLPGSQLLASADEQGNIAVKDLRMLGGTPKQPPRAGALKGLPPPTSSPRAGPGSGSSWGSYSGNATARGLVWEVRGAHQGQGVVRMIAGLRPLSDGTTGGSMLVTGGRDGSINVWSCHRGRHLQAIGKAHLSNAHASKGRNFFTDAFRSKSFGGPPAIVTGLALTADGLLSCGLDGNVKVHPFL